jgi:hypothetical protein
LALALERSCMVFRVPVWFFVSSFVEDRGRAPEWLIFIGGMGFVLVLGISAYWEADIRWLHFFQAWMYIATIFLSLLGSRWDISSEFLRLACGITQLSLSCLSWKWRKRSSVKITERTHEKAKEALHAGREGRHSVTDEVDYFRIGDHPGTTITWWLERQNGVKGLLAIAVT